jgi:hypothetical protein
LEIKLIVLSVVFAVYTYIEARRICKVAKILYSYVLLIAAILL